MSGKYTRRQQAAFADLTKEFPQYPLATLKEDAIESLAFRVCTFRDNEALSHLQQQSKLSLIMSNQLD